MTALLNKSDFASPLQRARLGNTYAFRHTCFRHFVQRSYQAIQASATWTIESLRSVSEPPNSCFTRYIAVSAIERFGYNLLSISTAHYPGHSLIRLHCTVTVCIFTGPVTRTFGRDKRADFSYAAVHRHSWYRQFAVWMLRFFCESAG